MKRAVVAFAAGFMLLAPPVVAQTSAGFKLTETAINAGGNPRDGQRPSSASFKVSLDAIGGRAIASFLSASFHGSGGFVSSYRPPKEVLGVRFNNDFVLAWDGDPSAGTYNLYRATL